MKNLKFKFQQFMQGRYGADIFSRDLIWISLGFMLINLFLRIKLIRWLPFLIIIYTYFRMFSKNFSKRYNENRVYTNFKAKITKSFSRKFKRLRDIRKYKYLKCPNCKQQLRVPRGKKEIIVTCKKCRTKFDAKS